jgi:transposase
VRIYPTKEQKQLINNWFHTHRHVYNQFLNHTKTNQDTKEWMNFYKMRNHFVIAKNNPLVEKWMKTTPKDIRADAIQSCISAYKTGFTQLKNKVTTHFELHYKTKKQAKLSYSVTIPKSALTNNNNEEFEMYKRVLNPYSKFKIKRRTKKKLKQKNIKIEHDCKLFFDGKYYYLLIPYKDITKKLKITNDNKIIAFDPGIRTFQTGFSEQEVFQISSKTQLIKKLHNKIDQLKSNKRKRKYMIRKQQKIKNIVNAIHWKTIEHVMKNGTPF